MVVLDDTDGDFVVACVATGQDSSGNITYAWKKVSLGDAVSPWTISQPYTYILLASVSMM